MELGLGRCHLGGSPASWSGRVRVRGTWGHSSTGADCHCSLGRGRPPHWGAVGHMCAGLAVHGGGHSACGQPGPRWAPHMGVGGGGWRVTCSRDETPGSCVAYGRLRGHWPSLWGCLSQPICLLGLLRGAGGPGVPRNGPRLSGGWAWQRGACRGSSGVVAGADEDARLSRGSVGP